MSISISVVPDGIYYYVVLLHVILTYLPEWQREKPFITFSVLFSTSIFFNFRNRNSATGGSASATAYPQLCKEMLLRNCISAIAIFSAVSNFLKKCCSLSAYKKVNLCVKEINPGLSYDRQSSGCQTLQAAFKNLNLGLLETCKSAEVQF